MRTLTMKRLVLSLCLLAAGAAPALAQTSFAALAAEPGFVDPTKLDIYDREEDLTIEVNLQGPLVQFVAEAAKAADPELSSALAKIKSVVFQLYKPKAVDLAEIRARVAKNASLLESRGWQRVVWLRDGDTVHHIYLKSAGSRIVGLTALFVDKDHQFGFINIAGEVDPGQIGRIGQRFNIEPLAKAQFEMNGGTAPEPKKPPVEKPPVEKP